MGWEVRERTKFIRADLSHISRNFSISVTDSIQLEILLAVTTERDQALAINMVLQPHLLLKLLFPGQVFPSQHFSGSIVQMKFK